MKHWFFVIPCIVCACGGSLSDEQRKKMREGMESQKIQHVTEGQIMDAALREGRKIVGVVRQAQGNQQKIDSLEKATQTTIKWLNPGTGDAKEIEKQLIDAYINSSITGSSPDNVQFIGTDSLLYSFPVVEQLPDGMASVKGMWCVWLPKKKIILSMP